MPPINSYFRLLRLLSMMSFSFWNSTRVRIPSLQVTTEGRPYLGAALGTEEYTQAFVTGKVLQWAGELEQLTTIARSQPHAAFTHGMTRKWTYFTGTMPGIGPYLLPLEEIIRTKLIPALTCRPPPNDTEHDLLALPACLANPTQATDTEFLFSTKITESLKEAILRFSVYR